MRAAVLVVLVALTGCLGRVTRVPPRGGGGRPGGVRTSRVPAETGGRVGGGPAGLVRAQGRGDWNGGLVAVNNVRIPEIPQFRAPQVDMEAFGSMLKECLKNVLEGQNIL